jgi:uncharacterized protein YjiS (DUF1127 family)
MPRLFRRHAPEAPPPPPTPRAVRRALPPASQLRRERRSLLRAREEALRDLGGLMLEMYRRDQFRQDLLVDRCTGLLALDERLSELDTLLAAAVSRGHTRPAARCECGAPLFWGAKFCGQCGRPVGAAPAARESA